MPRTAPTRLAHAALAALHGDARFRIADINNAGSGGYAGSITAALFLSRFVPEDQSWLHADIFGWNPKDAPGRPEGGEAQAIRALYT
jgi:leucyl aminopeptidase